MRNRTTTTPSAGSMTDRTAGVAFAYVTPAGVGQLDDDPATRAEAAQRHHDLGAVLLEDALVGQHDGCLDLGRPVEHQADHQDQQERQPELDQVGPLQHHGGEGAGGGRGHTREHHRRDDPAQRDRGHLVTARSSDDGVGTWPSTSVTTLSPVTPRTHWAGLSTMR